MARIKIEDWLTEDNLSVIESWKRRGLTDQQIADNIGISGRTFNRWKKFEKDGECPICQALKKGKQPLDAELENALIKKALGFTETKSEVTEIKDVGGDVTKQIKKTVIAYPPDTGALIFLLKNRLKGFYQDRPKSEEELEAIRIDNRIKQLKAELMERALKGNDDELDKVDQLLAELDNEIFGNAKGVLE